jgi:hypothetical protein
MSVSSPVGQLRLPREHVALVYCRTTTCFETRFENMLSEKISREMKTFEFGHLQIYFFATEHEACRAWWWMVRKLDFQNKAFTFHGLSFVRRRIAYPVRHGV